MSTSAASVTCHCGKVFDRPADPQVRHVNCPSCGSVFFLTEVKPAGADEEEETYGINRSEDAPAVRKSAGIAGVPDWLQAYRNSDDVKKSERDKTLALIERLGAVNPTLDPLGATLYLACTHADAETSVAALAKVAASGHPIYTATATALLAYVGPSDAAGAQQLLVLLAEAKDPAAEQLIVQVVRQLGPTSIVHVRSLIEVLGSRHAALYPWSVQCLKLIGPPARRSVDALLKSLKIANHSFRLAVIDALGAIGAEADRVLPILQQALKHESADYRAHGAVALGRFGSAAAKLLPQLKEAANDADETVRQAVARALSLVSAPAGAAQPAAAAPDTVPVVCACGKRLKAKPELAGKKVKCPGCGGTLVVPTPKAGAEPATPGGSADHKDCPTCLASVPGKAVLCVCCGHDFRHH